MSFVFNEMTEAVGAWLLAYPHFDWLCMVWRPSPLVGYTIRYRIRRDDPHDPEPWAGADTRTWYEFITPATETRAQVLVAARHLAAGLRAQYPLPARMADEVVVEGDGVALMEAIRERPWAFSKTGEDSAAWQRAYDAGQLPAQRRRAARLKGRRGKRRSG